MIKRFFYIIGIVFLVLTLSGCRQESTFEVEVVKATKGGKPCVYVNHYESNGFTKTRLDLKDGEKDFSGIYCLEKVRKSNP